MAAVGGLPCPHPDRVCFDGTPNGAMASQCSRYLYGSDFSQCAACREVLRLSGVSSKDGVVFYVPHKGPMLCVGLVSWKNYND
ncbi:hypothetical protein LINPERHAP1_LOCUS18706 [Linum perenne]